MKSAPLHKISGLGFAAVLLLWASAPLGARNMPLKTSYGAYFDYAVAEGEVTEAVRAEDTTPGVVRISIVSCTGMGPVPKYVHIFSDPGILASPFRQRRHDPGRLLKKGKRTYFRIVKDNRNMFTPIPRPSCYTGPVPWHTAAKAFSLRKKLRDMNEDNRLKQYAAFLTSGDPVKTKLSMTLSTWKQPWTDDFLAHVEMKDPDTVGRAAVSGNVKFYLGHDQYLKPLGRLWSRMPTDRLISFYQDRSEAYIYRRLVAREALIHKARQGDEQAIRLWTGVINSPNVRRGWERTPALEALSNRTGQAGILREFIQQLEALPPGQPTHPALLQGLANSGKAGLTYITGCLTGKRKMPFSKWGPRIGESLAKLMTGPDIGPKMTRLLSHTSRDARAFACAALASVRYNEASERLLSLYRKKTEHPKVIAAAGKALLSMDSETAIPFARTILSTKDPIIFAWKTGPHSSIRFNMKSTAIHRISGFDTPEAADALIMFVRAKPHNPKDVYLENKALKGLACMKNEKARMFIRGYILNEARKPAGIMLISALADNNTAEAGSTLTEIAFKRDHPLSLHAAAALISMPEQAEQMCSGLLSSDAKRSPALDYVLAKALCICRNSQLARFQADFLSHDLPAVRALAITGLQARFGTALGYDPFAETEYRNASVAAWRDKIISSRH